MVKRCDLVAFHHIRNKLALLDRVKKAAAVRMAVSLDKTRIDRHNQYSVDFVEIVDENLGLCVWTYGDKRTCSSLSDIRDDLMEIVARLVMNRHDVSPADLHSVEELLRVICHDVNIAFHIHQNALDRLNKVCVKGDVRNKVIVHKVEMNIFNAEFVKRLYLRL